MKYQESEIEILTQILVHQTKLSYIINNAKHNRLFQRQHTHTLRYDDVWQRDQGS